MDNDNKMPNGTENENKNIHSRLKEMSIFSMKKMFEKICRVAVCAVLVCIAVSLAPSAMAEECSTHIFDDDGFCTACGGYQEPNTDESGVYQIANAGNLYWFAAEVNGGSTTICAKLTKNIIVNSGVLKSDGTLNSGEFKDWTPIGSYYDAAGTFDGDGHSVSGLYFNDNSEQYVGLFGNLNGGTVQNVGVVDAYFCGEQYVGGVAGRSINNGTIKNCYNAATVIGTDKNYCYLGGVVGWVSNGTVESCYNIGTVSGSGESVGGVVGYIKSTTDSYTPSGVENCYNTGAVGGDIEVGGVVGTIAPTASGSIINVTNCFNSGAVSGYNNVGGVAGLQMV